MLPGTGEEKAGRVFVSSPFYSFSKLLFVNAALTISDSSKPHRASFNPPAETYVRTQQPSTPTLDQDLFP